MEQKPAYLKKIGETKFKNKNYLKRLVNPNRFYIDIKGLKGVKSQQKKILQSIFGENYEAKTENSSNQSSSSEEDEELSRAESFTNPTTLNKSRKRLRTKFLDIFKHGNSSSSDSSDDEAKGSAIPPPVFSKIISKVKVKICNKIETKIEISSETDMEDNLEICEKPIESKKSCGTTIVQSTETNNVLINETTAVMVKDDFMIDPLALYKSKSPISSEFGDTDVDDDFLNQSNSENDTYSADSESSSHFNESTSTVSKISLHWLNIDFNDNYYNSNTIEHSHDGENCDPLRHECKVFGELQPQSEPQPQPEQQPGEQEQLEPEPEAQLQHDPEFNSDEDSDFSIFYNSDTSYESGISTGNQTDVTNLDTTSSLFGDSGYSYMDASTPPFSDDD